MPTSSNITPTPYTHSEMLRVAIEEARLGLAEGGIPIGAALFDRTGKLLGRGHNRRVQENDPSVHGETDAFRKAGRQRSYRDKIMVTTLAPCWYCSGLVRQFGIGTLIVGESVNFQGGIDWLQENGVAVIDSTRRNASICWPTTSPRIPPSGTKTSAKSDWVRAVPRISPRVPGSRDESFQSRLQWRHFRKRQRVRSSR